MNCDIPIKPADIVMSVDLSGSFSGFLSDLKAPFLSSLSADIAAGGVTDAAYGVTSFVDYPVDPFGSQGDFIYNTNQPVTLDIGTAQAALDNLVSRSGADGPEDQLVALQQIALRAEVELANRPDAEHFVVLATDSAYHQAGDFPEGGPNNNNADLTDGTGPFGIEDFPSVAQVAQVLKQADVTPIFVVTADQLDTYRDLLEQLNAVDHHIGGSVIELSPDLSSDVAGAIIADLQPRGHYEHHGHYDHSLIA